MSRHLQAAGAAMALALTTMAPLPASAAEAMRVVRDPMTGELRAPNAAEALAFEKAEAQLRAAAIAAGQRPAKPAGPTEIRHPDGTVELKLGEDTMMYSVVTAAADGTLKMECLPAKEAQKLVKSAGKKPTKTAAAKAAHAHE